MLPLSHKHNTHILHRHMVHDRCSKRGLLTVQCVIKNTVTHYKASCIAACASSRRRIPIRLEFHCWYSCFFSKPMACKIHAHNYFPPCSLSQSKSGEIGGVTEAVSSCSLSLSLVKLVGSLWLGVWNFISFYNKVVPE